MQRVRGYDGGLASPGSVSKAEATAAAEEEEGLVADDVGGGAAGKAEEREEQVLSGDGEEEGEEELDLGLTLGAAKRGKSEPSAARWGPCCRILTAKDFPSLSSLGSPRSPSASSVSSSSGTNLGGGIGTGVAGTKRAAESISHDVGGSSHPPSQVVVGWPPIRQFRMNNLFNHSKDSTLEADTAVAIKRSNIAGGADGTSKADNGNKDHESRGKVRSSFFVKVKMDGDPIGRKVDLGAHDSYEALAVALELMFHLPTISSAIEASVHGAKISKLLNGSSEFALTYEDKDGDWMLVGDVPWGMFLEAVKRLRIMRTLDANGLGRSVHFGKHQEHYPSTRSVALY
ncbi:hypothetical protein C4D60_Mb09t20280 [Musa balbisiana]|uniref:Auxin-responsive protein n=1 Tax=Musa balbisiana TaxID=52838 RepID=A0A4S8IHR2_MUSBA|nr:hypothetical protein C4D60_Mb09t20280 [Musa balbisiana]